MEGTPALQRRFVVTKAYTDRLASVVVTYMYFSPRRWATLAVWLCVIVIEVGGSMLLGKGDDVLGLAVITIIAGTVAWPFFWILRLRSFIARQLPAGTVLWTEFSNDSMTSGRPEVTSIVQYGYYRPLEIWRGVIVLAPASVPRAVSFWPGELFPEEVRGRFGGG